MRRSQIDYGWLVENALRTVVRDVLERLGREGAPSPHHFYITFRTHHPGVSIPEFLRDRYPTDMTIVLQHQFWDLSITEQHLEVGLSFSGVPERLFIPLDAVTGFFDPSVQFGLKFEIHDKDAAEDKPAKSNGAVELPRKPTVPVARTAPKVPSRQAKPASESEKAKADKPAKAAKAEPGKDKDDAGAEVVSLDAFRKKS